MAMLVVAAEFTIPSPETPLGWAIVAAIAFTILWVLVRGLYSFLGKVSTDFLGPVFWSVFGILALIFLFTERPWENENLIEGEINVSSEGVEGLETHTDREPSLTQDELHGEGVGSHLYEPDHDHEDYGN